MQSGTCGTERLLKASLVREALLPQSLSETMARMRCLAPKGLCLCPKEYSLGRTDNREGLEMN
ncbi:MAG: hypothetical protein AAFR77_16880 [Cyanobacteria bacterium J06631_2]